DSLDSHRARRSARQPENEAAFLKPIDGETAVGINLRGIEESRREGAFIHFARRIVRLHGDRINHQRLELFSGRGVSALRNYDATHARAQKGLHLDAAHIFIRDFELRDIAQITSAVEIVYYFDLVTSRRESGKMEITLPVNVSDLRKTR